MAVADSHGIPIAIHAGSASPHEVTLVEETLEQNLLSNAPERLIGDGPTEHRRGLRQAIS
jgi:hypothetical protein